MDGYTATMDRMRVVRRFLVPVMSDDPIPGRPRCWGLAPADFELVLGGYACSSCLACWQPAILDTCPVCGEQRLTNPVEERPDWTGYEQERRDAIANPERTKLRPAHVIVEEISREHGVKPNR